MPLSDKEIKELLDKNRPTPPTGPGGQTLPGGEIRPTAVQRAMNRRQFRQSQQPGVSESRFRGAEERGVPLDIESGAGAGVRARLGILRTAEDKERFLVNTFGEGRVRRAERDGSFIVRVEGPDGSPVDLKVDEFGPSLGDAASLSGAGVEMLGAGLAIAASRGKLGVRSIGPRTAKITEKIGKLRGGKRLLTDVGIGEVGAQGTAGLLDATQRALGGAPVDPGEIFKGRAIQGVTQGAFGVGLGAGAGLVGRVITPFGRNVSEINIRAQKAVDNLERETGEILRGRGLADERGVKIPLTVGEQTGSPPVMRGESIGERVPGSSGVFKQLKAEQDQAILDIQDIISGDRFLKQPRTIEAVGRDVADVVKEGVEASRGALRAAEKDLAEVSTRDVEQMMGAVPLPGLTAAHTSQAMSNSAKDALAKHRAKFDQIYGDVHRIPGAEAVQSDKFLTDLKKLESELVQNRGGKAAGATPPPPVVEADAAVEVAEALRRRNVIMREIIQNPFDEFANKERLEEISFLDELLRKAKAAGAKAKAAPPPPKATRTGGKVERRLVPAKLLRLLDTFKEIGDQPRPLMEWIHMRDDVDDLIKETKVVKGINTRFMTRLRSIVTDAIEDGTGKVPELRDAWKNANDLYRTEVAKFDLDGVKELFTEPFQDHHKWLGKFTPGPTGATLGREQIDRYREVKAFFEEVDPPAWDLLRKQIRGDLLSKSSIDGNIIDAGEFTKTLRSFKKSLSGEPEIYREIVGPQAENLLKNMDLVNATLEGGRLPRGELERLLDEASQRGVPGKTFLGVQKVIRRQRELQDQFSNSVKKQVADGTLGDTPFEPSQMVDVLMKAPLREKREIMSQLSGHPALVEEIQNHTVKRLFYKARRKPSATDPSRFADDATQIVSGRSLRKAIGESRADEDGLRAILGNRTFNLLVELTHALGPVGAKDELFSASGGLVGASIITKMFKLPTGEGKGGVFSAIGDVVKYHVVARMLTNPVFGRMAGNTVVTDENMANILTGVAVSTPFIEGLVDEFGVEGAKAAAHQFRNAIQEWFDTSGEPVPAAQPATNSPALPPNSPSNQQGQ